jgi:hypothetical protein
MTPERFSSVSGQCSQMVFGVGGWYSHHCAKRPKVIRDGKKYCTVHDPEYIKAKEEEKRKDWEKDNCKSCDYHFQWGYYQYCPMCGLKRYTV